MSYRPIVIASLAILLGAACSAPSYQKVPRPEFGSEVSTSDKARVYVVRDAQVRGKIRSIRVYDGQDEIGTIGPGAFLCWERRPGRSVLKLVYEGPVIDGGEKEALVDLPLTAGEVGYCVVRVDAEGEPVAQLRPADEASGLIESSSPAPVK